MKQFTRKKNETTTDSSASALRKIYFTYLDLFLAYDANVVPGDAYSIGRLTLCSLLNAERQRRRPPARMG
ncbi:hypothetical protein V1478_009544 [Vespula squamosa]|uniref:Uncharacterized protein n=1 Tax=Vespula squamosa TaxID=30214 RepID=A0ABD2APY7_VESSQ